MITSRSWNLLPPSRKLLPFAGRPLAFPGATPAHLALWAFEEGIRTRFAAFVGVLEAGSFDALPHFKRCCVGAAGALLAERPQGERALLALVVNKLGDPDNKMASKVARLGPGRGRGGWNVRLWLISPKNVPCARSLRPLSVAPLD